MSRKRTVMQLGKIELDMLKFCYHARKYEEMYPNEILDATGYEKIPNEVIFEEYKNKMFTPYDFHDENKWSDEPSQVYIVLTCPHCGNSTWIRRDNGEYECAACEDRYCEADMCYTEKLC